MSKFSDTTQATPSTARRSWHVIDAEGQPLGRLASKMAMLLMGKHKPDYTPHIDTGDFVVVVNAEKVKLTGRKWQQLEHDYYTYYPSGHKYVGYAKLRETHPERIIQLAVRGMLPKTKMGRHYLGKLKCYRGPAHPHTAQQPQPVVETPLALKA